MQASLPSGTLHNARVLGTGHFLPPIVRTNRDEAGTGLDQELPGPSESAM